LPPGTSGRTPALGAQLQCKLGAAGRARSHA
jgi:hypothetical protein